MILVADENVQLAVIVALRQKGCDVRSILGHLAYVPFSGIWHTFHSRAFKEYEMNLEEAVVENLRGLPIDKQQEVLDFVQFLRQRSAEPRPQVTLRGLWNGVHITEDDIDEARQEMWGNFPREDV